MNTIYKNPCVRCGKERIVLKTWEEKIGESIIINTKTICPDPECQRLVNKDNKKQKDKYTALKLRSNQRIKERNDLRNLGKAIKKKN